MSKPAPIFIHSLFRTGSTYIFNVFRRSPEACFCYQEPLHELAWYARLMPDRLLAEPDEAALRWLRHPPLTHGYHRELREVWPAWRDSLREEAIYDAYFEPPGMDLGLEYWRLPSFTKPIAGTRVAVIAASSATVSDSWAATGVALRLSGR